MKTITKAQLEQALRHFDIEDVNCATIRQICAVAALLESISGEKFVHLELGNPGLAAEHAGIDAQCEALQRGVPNQYPNITGVPALKQNGSDFIKAFLDINIPARCIIPTVGSMLGSFASIMILGQRLPGKDTMLFLDPGFPAQHHQAKLLGLNTVSVDIYNYRGALLYDRLEQELKSGRITGIIYSNPNNPAWTNLTEDELLTIGTLATKYDAIVIEDLAYLGMDFRTDYSEPYHKPYIPTVARYTNNYILLLSSSKIFSYAGERIAICCLSESVADRRYEYFEKFYDMPTLGDSLVHGVLYTISTGASHSAQYAFSAMLRAAVEGKLDFVHHTKEYGHRAAQAKEIFRRHGFHLVYEKDGEAPIGDGFFFTVGYHDMTGPELNKELLRHGIATIPLKSTGSKQEGVRVTVSMLCDEDTFRALDERLGQMTNDK